MRLLVRMERSRSARAAIVLGLVVSNGVALAWNFLKRIFVASYSAEILLGDTDPWRAASFRVLASWFLGVDWCRGIVCFSLCGSFLNTTADVRIACRFV